jgi:hypothetical protein
VTAVDEFTYYAAGSPKVTNALVTLTDPYTGSNVVSGVTDAAGGVLFTNLTEAYYGVRVQADQHGDFSTTLMVAADQTFNLKAFLSRQMVSYNWTVTPTTVPDRYDFTLNTTFETYVPIPVVTVEPGAINLCSLTGQTNVVNLSLANHGLVAAKAARLAFASHPLWEITPLVEYVGDIAASSNVVVPVIIRRLPGATNGPSQIGAHLDWELPTDDGTRYYRVPIYVYNAGLHDCDPASPGSVPVIPPPVVVPGTGGWTPPTVPPVVVIPGRSPSYPYVPTPPSFPPPVTNDTISIPQLHYSWLR